jgi:hypothetical protein
MDACKLLDSLPPILKAFSIPQTKINSYYIRVAEAPPLLSYAKRISTLAACSANATICDILPDDYVGRTSECCVATSALAPSPKLCGEKRSLAAKTTPSFVVSLEFGTIKAFGPPPHPAWFSLATLAI